MVDISKGKSAPPKKTKVFNFGSLNKATLNIIFIPALLILIFISFFLYYQVNSLIIANNWVVHTEEVIKKTNSILFKLSIMESQQRAYLLTNDYQYLAASDELKIRIRDELNNIKGLTVDFPEQNQRIRTFGDLIDQRLTLLNQTAKLKRENKFDTPEGLSQFKQGQEISIQVRGMGDEITAVESVLLSTRNVAVLSHAATTNLILILGSTISIAFLLGVFILANSELTIRKKAEIQNKKSALQLRSIIESATDMIAAFDKEGRLIAINQPYQREFKRLFHNPIHLGMSLKEAMQSPSPEVQEIANAWRHYSENNHFIEIMLDKKKVVYEMIVSYMQNETGELEGSVHIIRNISKRIHEHDKLQRSYQSLSEGMNLLENKNKQITLLVEMSEIMLACSSPDELSLVMSKYSTRMLGFAKGYLYMMHPSKNYLEVIATWGEVRPQPDTFSPDQCWAIRRGRIHQVNANHNELVCDHVAQPEPTDTIFCVPLMAQNDIYGMLYIEIAEQESAHIEDHKLVITAFAELTALALANVRLRENLRHQSIRDPLTGLYNRRYLEDFLFKQIHQAKRTNANLSVLMFDLDHFKKLNDTYGHDAGDIALKEFAKILQNDIRVSDIAARYGGEEFILVLYGTSAEAACARATSILNAISMVHIRYGAQVVGSLTVSIGIADFPSDAETMETLIEAADRALYLAKNNGRNQYVLASQIDKYTPIEPPN